MENSSTIAKRSQRLHRITFGIPKLENSDEESWVTSKNKVANISLQMNFPDSNSNNSLTPVIEKISNNEEVSNLSQPSKNADSENKKKNMSDVFTVDELKKQGEEFKSKHNKVLKEYFQSPLRNMKNKKEHNNIQESLWNLTQDMKISEDIKQPKSNI